MKVYQWKESDGEEYRNRYFVEFASGIFQPLSEIVCEEIRKKVSANRCLNNNCKHMEKYHKNNQCHGSLPMGNYCLCKKFEYPLFR